MLQELLRTKEILAHHKPVIVRIWFVGCDDTYFDFMNTCTPDASLSPGALKIGGVPVMRVQMETAPARFTMPGVWADMSDGSIVEFEKKPHGYHS